MEKVINYFESENGVRLLTIVVTILVILFVLSFLKRMIPRYISSTDTRYQTRRFITFVGYVVIIIAVLLVYSDKLGGLTIFIGIAGAGIAFAVQELIASIAGFIAINFSHFYKVGDRIMLGGIKGDVIDISLLRTSLMEIGDWVAGDLYNGRITKLANSFVFKEPVFNYSSQFPFLWDEIKVPIKTDGDFEWATEEFQKILEEVQGDYAREALKHWKEMTKTLMVENARVEPMVKMIFDENWITFTLRYVVDFKARRTTKDIISRKVLMAIRNSNGKIEVASTAMEVTNLPPEEN